jgi:hypothetical protein
MPAVAVDLNVLRQYLSDSIDRRGTAIAGPAHGFFLVR